MSGLESMKKRMVFDGGNTSDGRFVKSKWRSFTGALTNSYQAEDIILDKNGKSARCLINPDKLSDEYDQKEISIDFDYGMAEGDTFYWTRTNSHWLVYLQEFCEEAYFRARIRRCNYKIDDDWIYLRGPVETSLVWNQKHNIEFNDMNYTILFYVTKTEENIEKYQRFKIVKFDGHNWRVAAVDRYSQVGIIEVYIEEYFDNEMEDAQADIEIVAPDTSRPHIEGLQIVRPYDTSITYSLVGDAEGSFSVSEPKKVKITNSSDNSCTIDILTGKSGSFRLSYNDDVYLDINIKSV